MQPVACTCSQLQQWVMTMFTFRVSSDSRSVVWFNLYAIYLINKHICCSVIFPDMQNTDFFNQPSCSHLQIKRQLGWIQVARMKLLWLVCQPHTIFLPFLQVFHWPIRSQVFLIYLLHCEWELMNFCFVGCQMRALRKSSGKVEIKMQHGRRLIESAARCWNLLMVSPLSLSLSLIPTLTVG